MRKLIEIIQNIAIAIPTIFVTMFIFALLLTIVVLGKFPSLNEDDCEIVVGFTYKYISYWFFISSIFSIIIFIFINIINIVIYKEKIKIKLLILHILIVAIYVLILSNTFDLLYWYFG